MTTCDPCDHDECDDCGRPMQTEADRYVHHIRLTGHVVTGARGMCSNCYQSWRSRQQVIGSPGWSGPPRRKFVPRSVSIGSWPEKHADVAEHRAHAP